jgi:hypothetical protein
MTDQELAIQETLDKMGIHFNAKFVPYTQTEAGKERHPEKNRLPSLNWKVDVYHGDMCIMRDVPYMMGAGNAPIMKRLKKNFAAYNLTVDEESQLWMECETGITRHGTRGKIEPNLVDFVWCLVMETDVLNYFSFEDWAPDMGYDVDSRSAEKIYRKVLEQALAFRNGIGQENLDQLCEVYEGY